MVQLMPLPLHHLLLSPQWFNFLVPAYPGCHGKEAVKWMYCSSSSSTITVKRLTDIWSYSSLRLYPKENFEYFEYRAARYLHTRWPSCHPTNSIKVVKGKTRQMKWINYRTTDGNKTKSINEHKTQIQSMWWQQADLRQSSKHSLVNIMQAVIIGLYNAFRPCSTTVMSPNLPCNPHIITTVCTTSANATNS